jgi:aerobic-type carbon monoxide dehydrogenase small subunit (CoxS/CutS family)
MKFWITVNDGSFAVDAEADCPLLYVLTDDLRLRGPRFGCGLGQCGSCSVLVDGRETRSCLLPMRSVGERRVVTLEGLAAHHARTKGLPSIPELHPVQEAMIEEQAPQCGYCYNGMVVKAAELLDKLPDPSDAEIRKAMNGHICRCGTYPRIMKAIKRAGDEMRHDAPAA